MEEVRARDFGQDQKDVELDNLWESAAPVEAQAEPAAPEAEAPVEKPEGESEAFSTKNLAVQLAGSVEDAFKETLTAIDNGAEEMNTYLREQGAPEFMTEPFFEVDIDLEKRAIPESDNKGLKVARDIGQFLIPFMGATKALKGMGMGTKAATGGGAFATSFFALDPAEDNLADMVQSYPALQNPVTEFLASDGESGSEARLKTAVSDVFGAVIGDGAIRAIASGVKAIKAHRQVVKRGFSDEQVTEFKALKQTNDENVTVGQSLKEESGKRASKEQVEGILSGELKVADIKKPRAPSKAAEGKAFKDKEEFAKKAFTEAGKTLDETKVLKSMGVADDPALNSIVRTVSEMLPKKAINWTEQEASALGLSFEEATQRFAKAGDLTAAFRRIAHEQVVDAKALQQAVADGGIDSVEATNALARLMDSGKLTNLAASEGGRLLQATKDTPTIAKALETIDVVSKKQMEGIINSFGNDPEKLLDFVGQVGRSKKSDLSLGLKTYWQNSVLSGPVTHMTNIAGNLTFMAIRPVERAIGSRLASESSNPAVVKAYTGEALQMYHGMYEGFSDGVKTLARAVGVDTKPLKDPDLQRLVGGSDFTDTGLAEGGQALRRMIGANEEKLTMKQFKEAGPKGQALDLLGRALTAPTDFMGNVDDFMKMASARGEKRARAFRSAMSDGLTGADLEERMDTLLNKSPIDAIEKRILSSINESSVEFAKETAFQADLGDAGKSILNIREKVPGMEYILPFVKTPTNMLTETFLRRTPFTRFTNKYKEAMKQGGAAAQEAQSKLYLGNSLLAVGTTAYGMGNITGSGPTGKREREAWLEVNQPWSIKLGDEWYSYQKIEPLGTLIGMGAKLGEVIEHQLLDDPTQEQEMEDVVFNAAGAMGKYMTDKSVLVGVDNLLGALDNEPGAVEKMISQIAGGFVPFSGATRTLAADIDPELHEVDGILDRIISGLPGLSKDLPNKRNRFGEKVMRREKTVAFVLPISHSPGGAGGDKAVEELNQFELENGYRIGTPGRNFNGIKLELTEQDERLKHLSEFKVDGKSLKQTLLETKRTIEAYGDEVKSTSKAGVGDIMIKTYRGFLKASDAVYISKNPTIRDKIVEGKVREVTEEIDINPRTGEARKKTTFVGAK